MRCLSRHDEIFFAKVKGILQRKQWCQAVHVHVLITKFNIFGFQIRDIVGFLVAEVVLY